MAPFSMKKIALYSAGAGAYISRALPHEPCGTVGLRLKPLRPRVKDPYPHWGRPRFNQQVASGNSGKKDILRRITELSEEAGAELMPILDEMEDVLKNDRWRPEQYFVSDVSEWIQEREEVSDPGELVGSLEALAKDVDAYGHDEEEKKLYLSPEEAKEYHCCLARTACCLGTAFCLGNGVPVPYFSGLSIQLSYIGCCPTYVCVYPTVGLDHLLASPLSCPIAAGVGSAALCTPAPEWANFVAPLAKAISDRHVPHGRSNSTA